MRFGLVCLLILAMVAGATAALALTRTVSIDVTYRDIQIVFNGERAEVPAENEPFIHA